MNMQQLRVPARFAERVSAVPSARNPNGTGFAQYTMTNGIEGSWTPDPTRWDNSYLENLFGSNAELRLVAELYSGSDGEERLVKDFVAAWSKVMMLDRFDVTI